MKASPQLRSSSNERPSASQSLQMMASMLLKQVKNTHPNKPRATEPKAPNMNTSARQDYTETTITAQMLGEKTEKASMSTRAAKTSKGDTRDRSIEDESSFVQMTFASEGMLQFASIKDSLKQSKLNSNLQFS